MGVLVGEALRRLLPGRDEARRRIAPTLGGVVQLVEEVVRCVLPRIEDRVGHLFNRLGAFLGRIRGSGRDVGREEVEDVVEEIEQGKSLWVDNCDDPSRSWRIEEDQCRNILKIRCNPFDFPVAVTVWVQSAAASRFFGASGHFRIDGFTAGFRLGQSPLRGGLQRIGRRAWDFVHLVGNRHGPHFIA
jgi:hypothetical protein